MEILLKLAQQKWIQLAGCLLLGITIGALFYPTKSITEKTTDTLKEQYSLKEQETQKVHDAETKKLTDQLTSEESSHKEFQEETSKKIQSLTTENDNLKKTTHHKTYKLIKPDGTIVETEMDDSDTESSKQVTTQIKQEFDQKVKSIEDKWKKIHEDRVAELTKTHDAEVKKLTDENKTLSETKTSEKTVEVNKKSLRTEVGVATNKNAYLHASYTLWGPMFIGGGVSGGHDGFDEGRLGLGIEF